MSCVLPAAAATGMEHFVRYEYRDAVIHLEASSTLDSNVRRGNIFAAVALLNLTGLAKQIR